MLAFLTPLFCDDNKDLLMFPSFFVSFGVTGLPLFAVFQEHLTQVFPCIVLHRATGHLLFILLSALNCYLYNTFLFCLFNSISIHLFIQEDTSDFDTHTILAYGILGTH